VLLAEARLTLERAALFAPAARVLAEARDVQRARGRGGVAARAARVARPPAPRPRPSTARGARAAPPRVCARALPPPRARSAAADEELAFLASNPELAAMADDWTKPKAASSGARPARATLP
jgi:hypothetical protein